jgi:uncharacterized protein (DUF433 family)
MIGVEGQTAANLKGMLAESVIVRDPEIMSGTPCFRGTRVPFQTLLDYLEGGDTLDEFLDHFPGVTRDMAVEALESAKESLLDRIA